jgi:hypothetical protein
MLKLQGNANQNLPRKICNAALLFGMATLTTGAQFMPLPLPVTQLPLERTDMVDWGTPIEIDGKEEVSKPLWASEIEEMYQTYRVLAASA